MLTSFYDKYSDLRMWSHKSIPHCEQEGTIQFITFRLADSLPVSKIRELKEAKAIFIAQNPEPWNEETKIKFQNIIGRTESKLLDNGYGSCILRNPKVRTIVVNSLHFNDNKRYDLIAYVVMSNHVHLLLKPYQGEKLENIIHSIKSFTANRINQALGKSGSVWMEKYHDRMLRSIEHLDFCIKYIRSNPRFLQPHEYTLFVSPSKT